MSQHAIAPARSLRHDQRGLSYVEVLIAVVIVAVCLAPMVDALRDGVRAAGTQRDYTINQQRLKSCFELVLAKSFTTLDNAAQANLGIPAVPVPALGLDPLCANNPAPLPPDPLLITLYRYDGSVKTDLDKGLLWIKVAIEGSSLQLNTLKSRW